MSTRDLVVMMGGSQPLHPGSTPGVCTARINWVMSIHREDRPVDEWSTRAGWRTSMKGCADASLGAVQT